MRRPPDFGDEEIYDVLKISDLLNRKSKPPRRGKRDRGREKQVFESKRRSRLGYARI